MFFLIDITKQRTIDASPLQNHFLAMTKHICALSLGFSLALLAGCGQENPPPREQVQIPVHSSVSSAQVKASSASSLGVHTLTAAEIPKTEEEWKKRLSPEQYEILREQGTETPFSSPLDFETRPGTYYGADCGEPLFRSEQKYDSGTGWPSFWAPITPDAVTLHTDTSLGITRTEVVSTACGGHLGHVFDDGPPPTGQRYCMNGLALNFVPDPVSKE